MPRTLKLAAIQLDAAPAPISDRLARARQLIERAALAGAQLIVLPEVFNTGYCYTDENFQRAEMPDGQTITWMKNLAAQLSIHLAGSLLLRDGMEIYNTLLLVAPNGRSWRYDKSYPWAWERAYFREGHGVSIAHTDLGDFGLMICWDAAHTALWRQYAGQIDLMLISSCPPDVSNPTFEFPNGDRVTYDQLGPFFRTVKGVASRVFGEGINRQSAWLRVPTINTVGAGKFVSNLPSSLGSLLLMLPFAPWLIKYLPQARSIQMICDMTPGCKIVAADGNVLSELSQAQGEDFALAEVTLPDEKPYPIGMQPRRSAPWLSYFSSDLAIPWLMRSIYRRGSRR